MVEAKMGQMARARLDLPQIAGVRGELSSRAQAVTKRGLSVARRA
jgi:hypothetical protein